MGDVRLIEVIESANDQLRDRCLEELCGGAKLDELLAECEALDAFRHRSDNLYHRVRALLFLHALHRFQLPARPDLPARGRIPWEGHSALLERRFDAAIATFREAWQAQGPSQALASALAAAYRGLAFQTLADQVRRSVRSVRGNAWMFAAFPPGEHPLRVRDELRAEPAPTLRESTPVRMDLSHSGWSDIFFLGMDHPEGARVLNVSVDLGVRGRHDEPSPPIQSTLRIIDRPVLRLHSVDLACEVELTETAQVFDIGADYLGLLKAAVVAAGIVPPAWEGEGHDLGALLARLCGEGHGLELTSAVRDIPKGSRLAVSTNLLASLIAVCMRATGQTASLEGPLTEEERRLIAARAILGEWLGGSGGGWQDSGGLWPGIKLIHGVAAAEGDPEHGISRGRLLPHHELLTGAPLAPALQRSIVLFHGGIAKNVGPILEMVTEKYLLRSANAWRARAQARGIFDEIVAHLHAGDARGIGDATTRNFRGPIRAIIPEATDLYTETLIDRVAAHFGDDYWGFGMLGGMSGGGMAFFFAPHARDAAADALVPILREARDELAHALPFAMEPVVYDFAINDAGSRAELLPAGPPDEQAAPTAAAAARSAPDRAALDRLLAEHGFDRDVHEQIRAALRAGEIGLARNRLPATTVVEDVRPDDVVDATGSASDADVRAGEEALAAGRAAVVTLAAGAGSRWTQGAGVVKALHPFAVLGGRHRSFLETHLAKSRAVGEHFGTHPAHVLTTSYLTHAPIEAHLARMRNHGYAGPLHLSPGRAVGLRMIPTLRDLRFAWEETAQQVLDERAQAVRQSVQGALLEWARASGEAADYTDNVPLQCMHPVGHFFEVPNLLRNGTLARLLAAHPQLDTLLLHNVDTLGATLDPGLLGQHLRSGADLTFEVVPRRIEDRGGGLARIDGEVRLVESLALPRESDELRTTLYNSMTTWISVDGLLRLAGLGRGDLGDTERVDAAVRRLAERLPTYITLKDVKKRWGHAQEDVYPVCQFEKLWSDVTTLPELACRYAVVPRRRGQQLKDPAELDPWLHDGSAAWVESLCSW